MELCIKSMPPTVITATPAMAAIKATIQRRSRRLRRAYLYPCFSSGGSKLIMRISSPDPRLPSRRLSRKTSGRRYRTAANAQTLYVKQGQRFELATEAFRSDSRPYQAYWHHHPSLRPVQLGVLWDIVAHSIESCDE